MGDENSQKAIATLVTPRNAGANSTLRNKSMFMPGPGFQGEVCWVKVTAMAVTTTAAVMDAQLTMDIQLVCFRVRGRLQMIKIRVPTKPSRIEQTPLPLVNQSRQMVHVKICDAMTKTWKKT